MTDEAPRSILVVKPSSFGDVIHTLPAVALLKRAWPEARLSWVINPEWAPLLEGNPDVASIIPFPRQEFRGWDAWRFPRWCREKIAPLKPDLTVDFQGLLRSAWIGRASQPRLLAGMSDAREGARWFYQQIVEAPRGSVHAVERYLAVARGVIHGHGGEDLAGRESRPSSGLMASLARRDGRSFGSLGLAQDDSRKEAPALRRYDPEFFVPPGVRFDDPRWQAGDYVLLHPFSRGQAKSLTGEQVARLCRLLAPRRVLLAGRRGQNEVGAVSENCVDLLDRTSLAQFIWCTRHASAVVTVDSGPSHLAAALGRPMIAIHTWSDPRRVGPYARKAFAWKNGQLLPMHELLAKPDEFFHQPPSPLRGEDIAEIARRAILLSGSCA